MDGIFVIIVLLGIVNVILRAAKKQQSGSTSRRSEQPWQRMLGDLGKSFQETASGKPPMPLSPARPSAPKVYREGAGAYEGRSDSGGGPGLKAPALSSQTVTGEGVSAPVTWRGSLPGTTEAVMSVKAAPSPPIADSEQSAHAPLQLAFTRDSLLQAVVMQEVLTRPRDRRRRWSVR